jgi:hypothetical protein
MLLGNGDRHLKLWIDLNIFHESLLHVHTDNRTVNKKIIGIPTVAYTLHFVSDIASVSDTV